MGLPHGGELEGLRRERVECYHCPTVHTKSFSDAFVTDANIYELVETGGLLCQFTPYNARRSNTRWGGQTGDGFRIIYMWPTSFWAQDDQVASRA